MELPPIDLGNLDIKLSLGGLVLSVHYVKFGFFYVPMPEHSHSIGSYELHYIPTGQGTLVAGDKSYPLGPGSLYMTGPLVPHEQLTNLEDPMAEYCVFLEVLSADPLSSQVNGCSEEDSALSRCLLDTPFWIGQDCGEMLILFQLLAAEISRRKLGYLQSTTRLLELILIKTLRQYSKHSAAEIASPVKTLDDSRLLIIENSFLYEYAALTLSGLADRLGLSIRQTERAIFKQFGLSFNEKKLSARMGASAYLLATTKLSIAEISSKIGFSTPESFTVAFKRYYRITPTLFRKSQ
ncbi:AraC family transcriptional regulator [Paenibacillus sp. AR247]|uniref:helix-turn-helix domain-containing protein n=1 Tax=Paenibacillus sp. AR247 TaxID=1631599 RepID=UPI000CF93225|nr:AraC family transcriptional regulator [Paenibacillus sp. AR247]PQP88662.1 AraC family transcriptional regulator [Paenibacillus sp. AR247]